MKKKERNGGKDGGREGWGRKEASKQARQENYISSYYLTIILTSYIRAELVSTIAAPSNTLNSTTLDRYTAL